MIYHSRKKLIANSSEPIKFNYKNVLFFIDLNNITAVSKSVIYNR